jgi:hypothetical protein
MAAKGKPAVPSGGSHWQCSAFIYTAPAAVVVRHKLGGAVGG